MARGNAFRVFSCLGERRIDTSCDSVNFQPVCYVGIYTTCGNRLFVTDSPPLVYAISGLRGRTREGVVSALPAINNSQWYGSLLPVLWAKSRAHNTTLRQQQQQQQLVQNDIIRTSAIVLDPNHLSETPSSCRRGFVVINILGASVNLQPRHPP